MQRNVLPGFGPALGATLAWLGVLVLFPLASLLWAASASPAGELWRAVWNERALAACRLSLGASLAAAIASGALGFLLAWVLVRFEFRGKHVLDALVDVPFALPTAVAGLAYSSLHAEDGWIGRFTSALGVPTLHTRAAVVLVLVFVSLPLVVRCVQPVLRDLGTQAEEAAWSLGATRGQAFRWVVLPCLAPSLLTGVALAFARALGEYGSVIFVSGNLPGKTEIAPLLVVSRLESYDFAGASAIALVLLALSFAVNGALNLLARRSARHG